MRITRDTLLHLASDTVSQRVRVQRDIVSVYATGSLLYDEPLLGGVTDLDLVFIHDREPAVEREIIRFTDEVTLDIAHHNQERYRQPRHLRVDPWLGPAVAESTLLMHDTQHWFEFTQSSVRSMFSNPENVLHRARQLEDAARQNWFTLQAQTSGDGAPLLLYIKTIGMAANTIASLSGAPLTDRRFLLNFPVRAEAIERPGLTAGLLGLLGGGEATAERMKAALPDWSAAYLAAGKQPRVSPRLNACRLPYYRKAMEAMLESESPETALWCLLRTWSAAVSYLPEDDPLQKPWLDFCVQLEMDKAHFPERLEALDAYLDNIEEALDEWAEENGAV